jgi:NADP-dependent aldehyde dehydrogenase
MTAIAGIDPRTGDALPPVVTATATADVAALATAAAAAAPKFGALSPVQRATILDDCADAIEAHRGELIDIASRETGFGEAKLNGELNRAAYQFRFFAEVVREGSYLEATIDPAAATPMGPRPDLRRILIPIGPVAVFGASNFPFAFSVLGGDTASALSAGNPVIVKAHDSHPGTSKQSYDILAGVLENSAAPKDCLGIVYGLSAGAALVAQPAIKAVGFTGSLTGGKALLSIINDRDEPIPFYGELSSLNPVVITPAAAEERGAQIGAELVASFTVGSGQLCTKPGFVLIPAGAAGDAVLTAAAASLQDATGHLLLNPGIFNSYVTAAEALAQRGDGTVISAPTAQAGGFAVTPVLFETRLNELDPAIIHEVFGPLTIAVRYDAQDLLSCAATMFDALPASLTATLHTGADEDHQTLTALTALSAGHAGRIIFNGYPTGVAVSWAQTHGGPWPSTNSLHTSVGATAIRRFLRPVTFQDAPQAVLPPELRDGEVSIPRRIDGRMRTGTE